MPFKAQRKAITAKIESTYGTDATPGAASDAILVRNWNFNPLQLNYEQRQMVLTYMGNDGALVAGKFAQVSFEVEMAGSGTAGTAPKYDSLLQGCALSSTNNVGTSQVYAPVSTGEKSLTIYFYMDGQLYKMLGAKGSVSCVLEAGRTPVFRFTFTGLYAAVTDAALITPTLSGFTKPLPVNNANTTPMSIHSYAGVFSSFSLDVGNQVQYRNVIGGEYVVFMDRATKGSVVLETPTIAAKDFFTIANNGTLGGFTVTHGTTSGNKVTIAGSNAQITTPQLSEQDGISMLQLGMEIQPSSAGNDEFSITVL